MALWLAMVYISIQKDLTSGFTLVSLVHQLAKLEVCFKALKHLS